MFGRRKIKALEAEAEKYRESWLSAIEGNGALFRENVLLNDEVKSLKEEVTSWKEKYLGLLEKNIEIAEKVSNIRSDDNAE